MARTAQITRKTGETNITVSINLDGTGKSEISTGIGFFDHMLDAFARHGLFDLMVKVDGDLNVDCHHSVEDTGIVLGTAIKQALGDKMGIRRYGQRLLPMDEVLAQCVIDLSGRPYLVFDAEFAAPNVGDFDTETVKEFFYAVSYSAMMNLNMKVIDHGNAHHEIEALFKAFAKALDEATGFDERIVGVLSTKGTI